MSPNRAFLPRKPSRIPGVFRAEDCPSRVAQAEKKSYGLSQAKAQSIPDLKITIRHCVPVQTALRALPTANMLDCESSANGRKYLLNGRAELPIVRLHPLRG